MLNNFKFLAHFSDVNLGAIRDSVHSAHLSSDLPDSLYKSVLQQYPFDMSSSEREYHSKALIEYAAYSNSSGKSKFFYWLTPAPSSKTYPKNNKDKDTSFRYETSRPAPVVPSDDGDGALLSSTDDVHGGIPARHMLLSETVSGGLSITGDFLLSDLDELLKDYPVNGCAQPNGLE